jgi:sulfur carrier protein ThiS
MAVTLIFRKKEYLLEGPLTLQIALEKLGLSAETHMAVRYGELLQTYELLKDGDVVKLVPEISGG